MVPENDDRDLKALLIPKVMASKDRFDVHFQRDYTPPALGEWEDSENQLAEPGKPYYLRANTGPRWLLGGVLSRPFVLANQTAGKFAISSIESSAVYRAQGSALARWFTFAEVDHCFCVQEGLLRVKLQASGSWSEVREGQTLVVAAGETFTLDFGSRFVRVWTFTNGNGIEEVIQQAGDAYESFVIPESPAAVDEGKVVEVCERLKVKVAKLE